jgi:hypothetical protein
MSVVSTPLYHVMFDGEPEVQCHVCTEHRLFADLLPCPDHEEHGACSHIQYADCACDGNVGCVACRNQMF